MSTVNMLRKNKNIQIMHKKNNAKLIKIIKYDNILTKHECNVILSVSDMITG